MSATAGQRFDFSDIGDGIGSGTEVWVVMVGPVIVMYCGTDRDLAEDRCRLFNRLASTTVKVIA